MRHSMFGNGKPKPEIFAASKIILSAFEKRTTNFTQDKVKLSDDERYENLIASLTPFLNHLGENFCELEKSEIKIAECLDLLVDLDKKLKPELEPFLNSIYCFCCYEGLFRLAYHLHERFLSSATYESKLKHYFFNISFNLYRFTARIWSFLGKKTFYDKRILIVGPANFDVESELENREFDAVVYLNSLNEKIFEKTHSAAEQYVFFSSERARAAQASEFLDTRVSGFYLKKRDDLKELKKKKITHLKLIKNFNYLLNIGTFNFLPACLLSVAADNPRWIYVIGADFMLDLQRKEDYYPASFERSSNTKEVFLFNCLGGHEPLCQFVFVRDNLTKLSLVGGRRFFLALKYEPKEYMAILQELYSRSSSRMS